MAIPVATHSHTLPACFNPITQTTSKTAAITTESHILFMLNIPPALVFPRYYDLAQARINGFAVLLRTCSVYRDDFRCYIRRIYFLNRAKKAQETNCDSQFISQAFIPPCHSQKAA